MPRASRRNSDEVRSHRRFDDGPGLASMTFPRRYLAEDEKIIVERGLHPIRLTRTVGIVVALFAGCACGVLLWKNSPQWFGLALGVVFVATLAYLFIKVLSFRSTQLILTTKRVIYRSGVVRRVARDIPLSSIQDIETIQSFSRRLIGIGDLKVSSTAVRDGEPFYDLRRARDLEPMIREAMEARRGQELREALQPEVEFDPQEAHRRMMELHDKGVITGSELEAHRRSLGLHGDEV